MSATKLMVGAMAAGCLFAAGCVVRERPVYYAAPPAGPPPAAAPEGEGVIVEGPPAAVVEVIPVAPGPEVKFFWIGGWYEREGGLWVWHRGYWARRPHAGAVWIAHRWVRGPHGWVLERGHWR